MFVVIIAFYKETINILYTALICPKEKDLLIKESLKNGAGEGNRTLVTSLEGWRSTIELHPHVVGAAGFEPATPWSRTKCATKLRYAPVT